jgi:signal transduction histidine kinase
MQLKRKIKELFQVTQKTNSHLIVSRLIIVIVTTLAYVAIFWLLNDRLGPIVSVFLSAPIIVTSLFFGSSAGLLASFIGFALNIYLQTSLGGLTLIQVARGWPGYLAILVIGYIAGYLHDNAVTQKQSDNEKYYRERFIAIINIATKSITGISNPEEAYFRLVSHLTNLFTADYAYLIQWDETNSQAFVMASTNFLKNASLPIPLIPEEATVVEAVLQSEHSIVIEDVQNSTYIINPSPFKELSLQTSSALIIPLCSKDYCFGAVILAFDTHRKFTPEEITYVELASNQITLALRTVQQQLEIETQLKEAKALANIERALSESERVGVDKVLQLIVDSAIELIPKANNVILHLVDDENQILVPRAVAGYAGKNKGQLNMRLGEGVAGQVVATGKVITIADVFSDSRFLKGSITLTFRSLVVAPIQSHDKCIGTISIHSDLANAFNIDEVILLETLGTQVAIGIDNANLLETTRQNLKEINVLYRISQVLATSLDANQVMRSVADLLRHTFGYQHVIIFVVDPESRDLIARQGSGKVTDQLIKQGYRLSFGESIIGHVANTGEPFVTNDVDNVVFYTPHPLLPDIKSAMTVPIVIENHVIGILDVQQTLSTPFNEQQLNLLSAVADQLAVALNRIDILDSLEQRVRQRTHDLVVLYNLITIISENWRLQDLLELSLVLTLETVKADRGIIYLTDGKDDPGLKPIIQRGFTEGFQIDADTLPDDELAREVFKKHKALAAEDLAEKPAYAKFEGMNCYAGIPITVRGAMRGVFSLFANENDSFGSDEMALLTSIADHLGIGIENSILWEQSRENAALEERNRLARNLHDSVSQSLYSLTLMAGTTRKMLDLKPDFETIKNSVTRLGDTAHQALKEMRLLLYELRPAVLDSEGLINALQHRIGTVEERLGVKVDLQAKGLPEFPSDIEDALYHIALEALNNIVKHSESATAQIKLTSKNGNIVMEISDSGKGFDTHQPPKGQGLRNMRERVQMLGGQVTITSNPGKGTRLRVQLKLPSGFLVSS